MAAAFSLLLARLSVGRGPDKAGRSASAGAAGSAADGEVQRLSRLTQRKWRMVRSTFASGGQTRGAGVTPPRGMRLGVRAGPRRALGSLPRRLSRLRRPACLAVGARIRPASRRRPGQSRARRRGRRRSACRQRRRRRPAARCARRAAGQTTLEQVLPEDPVERLEDRDLELLGDPDALRRAGLDRRDQPVALARVVVIGLDDRRARLAPATIPARDRRRSSAGC